MNRKTLSKHIDSKKCLSKIDELNSLYKKKFNRNSGAELYYSQSGSDTKAIHEITIYYSEENKNDVVYFESLLKDA